MRVGAKARWINDHDPDVRNERYVEAIAHRGGGVICETSEQWLEAVERLRDPAERADMGTRARQTVAERYSKQVVSEQYRALLHQLIAHDRPLAVESSQAAR
jgi:glycosyltransferase involved in cell wall biosynthesis